jgi:hypothetical protein
MDHGKNDVNGLFATTYPWFKRYGGDGASKKGKRANPRVERKTLLAAAKVLLEQKREGITQVSISKSIRRSDGWIYFFGYSRPCRLQGNAAQSGSDAADIIVLVVAADIIGTNYRNSKLLQVVSRDPGGGISLKSTR